MAGSKYGKPPQAPPVLTTTPDRLISDCEGMLAQTKALEDQLVREVKSGNATFQNVILPLAQLTDQHSLQHRIYVYQAVATESALREASLEAIKKSSVADIESLMRDDVFRLVEEAYQKHKDDTSLDAESRKLVKKMRQEYIRMGLSLPPGPSRDRFAAIQKRLSEVVPDFMQNLNEEKGGLWLTRQELDGVPEDVLGLLKEGEKGTEDEGKLWLTFKYPDFLPTMNFCKVEETRRRAFIANDNKCNANVALFKETITLRDEAAKLLGYPNHAAYKLEDKMAKSPGTVDTFLADLRARITERGAREIEGLKKLKAEESGNGEYLFQWDRRYYDNLMRERDYQLDQNRIAEFFPLESCTEGMLAIFEKLFGLVFVRLEPADRDAISETGKGADITWHPDVQMFAVWNDDSEGNGFVGYLHLDLHPRDGKYGHAANMGIQSGFVNANGTRHYASTALVCNFSKPTATKPSLLKHDELVTMFHELGHGIHDLVGTTKFSRFSGHNVVYDFVEAPSQMLENWCWTPDQLKALSKHWSYTSPEAAAAWQAGAKDGEERPPETIPDELVQSLIDTRYVNDAITTLRQLHIGMFDMAVHEPSVPVDTIDPSETWNKMWVDIAKLAGPEVYGEGYLWGHGETTFGHLMGGYDAGYYGYLWSQVYSMDMFYTAFKKDPMNAEAGRNYRHLVLGRGGSRDEMESLEEFLGRKPNSDAFFQELGVA